LLTSDGGVTADGWYIDDVALTYVPYQCTYPADVPGVPVLVSPPDGTITSTQEITLTWEAGLGWLPNGYNLELDGVVYTMTETFSPTVLSAGTHSWRVRAFNLQGYSEYSEPWSLTIETIPGVPLLVAPGNGTTTVDGRVVFVWTDGGGGGEPDGYIFVWQDTPLITFTTPVTSVTLLIVPGEYTWSVVAYNDAGASAYAAPWTIKILNKTLMPTIRKG
jgi:hypothetical protein